jgi:ketosteroid isomerase-like protein
MRNYIFCTLGLLAYLMLSPDVALACSCSNPALEGKSVEQQIAEAKERAAVIFSGKVVEIIGDKNSGDETSGEFEVKLNVLESWKGIAASRISVFTANSSSLCGYTFRVGESYLIYAHDFSNGKQKLETNICTRTRRLADAGEDLQVLQTGTAPNQDKNRVTSRPSRAEQKLIEVDRRWTEARMRNDLLTVRRLTAQRYIGTDPDGNIISGEEASARMSGQQLNADSVIVEDVEARIHGSAGIVVGRMSAQGSGESSVAFRFTHVWVNQGGLWKLAASHTHRVAR